MKSSFPMYYAPNEAEFKKLWNESIIVFDANVLLNLYRYTINTKDAFLNVMESLSSRIFIPHQVALEYHSNRVRVIWEQVEAYQSVKKSLTNASESIIAQLTKELNEYSKKHPIIDVGSIKETIRDSFKELVHDIEGQKESHPNYIENDTIRDFLDNNIKQMGAPFTQVELDSIYKEGEIRFKQERPPGYKDGESKKDKKHYQGLVVESKYGDLIVWKQIINEARLRRSSVILVTDDTKEDWWKKELGKTIGPRVELIDEFLFHTEQNFHMYGSHQFLEYAQKHLKQVIDEAAVNEVRELYLFNDSEEEKNKLNNTNLVLVRRKDGSKFYRSKNIVNQTDDLYITGDRVFHQRWGEGTVLVDSGETISIIFPEPIGIIRMVKSLSPITRIAEKPE